MKKCCKSLLLLSILAFSSLFAPFGGAATDSIQYIPIDEIEPGMEAYCLSVFAGMEIERLPLKLLSVVRGVEPGQDILQRVIERVPHVEAAGDIGRRNHNGIWLGVVCRPLRAGQTAGKGARVFPTRIMFRFHLRRLVGFFQSHDET